MSKNDAAEREEKSAAHDEEFSKHWPAWHYGPDGKGEIFNHPDDVPEGWTDDPYAHEREKAGAPDEDDVPSTDNTASALDRLKADYEGVDRDLIKDELKSRGVEFKGNASTETLAALLLKELANDDGAGPD